MKILTIRWFLSNYYISIDVSMDYMTISTATNGALYAHQAVFLHQIDNTIRCLEIQFTYSIFKRLENHMQSMKHSQMKLLITASKISQTNL